MLLHPPVPDVAVHVVGNQGGRAEQDDSPCQCEEQATGEGAATCRAVRAAVVQPADPHERRGVRERSDDEQPDERLGLPARVERRRRGQRNQQHDTASQNSSLLGPRAGLVPADQHVDDTRPDDEQHDERLGLPARFQGRHRQRRQQRNAEHDDLPVHQPSGTPIEDPRRSAANARGP